MTSALDPQMPTDKVSMPLSSWLAMTLALFVLIDSFWRQDWAALGAGGAVIAYLALEMRNMSRPPFVLTCVFFATLLVFLVLGWLSRDLIIDTARRAGFLGFFIIAVNSLKEAAQSSPMVQQSGAIVVRQAPGKRYAWLSLGGAMIGVLVNMGAVVLLATMVRQSVDKDPNDVEPRIRAIRKQRMTIAAMRGMSTVCMWSPTSVTIALVITAMPELRWIDIMPIGICATVIVMLIGWGLDRWSYPRNVTVALPPERQNLWPLVRMLGLIAMLPIISTSLSFLLAVPSTTALMITFPTVALGWIFAQNFDRGAAAAARVTRNRTTTEILPSLALFRNEVAIFACSGGLSVLATSQIDFDAVGAMLTGIDIGPDWLMVAVGLLMMGLTMIGLNPILSAGVLMEIITRVPGLEYSQLALAMTITFTWSLSILTGPMTTTVHIVARLMEVAPMTIALKWSGLYTVLCMGVLVAGLLIFV